MVSFNFQQAFDYSTFVRSVSQQAEAELGGAGRWAEALQFTLMSYNQSPHPLLGNDVSPFEVMFGRSPWPRQKRFPPPWLDDNSGMNVEEEDESTEPDLPKVHLTTRFEPGDRVFVRNFNPATRNRVYYFRGEIKDVDWGRDFPYRVQVSNWDDDENDGKQMVLAKALAGILLWVAPYDIAPTSFDMLVSRDTGRREQLDDLFCKCGSEDCTLIRSDYCDREMSRACCERMERMGDPPCGYHNEAAINDSYTRLKTLAQKFEENTNLVRKERERRYAVAFRDHNRMEEPVTVDVEELGGLENEPRAVADYSPFMKPRRLPVRALPSRQTPQKTQAQKTPTAAPPPPPPEEPAPPKAASPLFAPVKEERSLARPARKRPASPAASPPPSTSQVERVTTRVRSVSTAAESTASTASPQKEKDDETSGVSTRRGAAKKSSPVKQTTPKAAPGNEPSPKKSSVEVKTKIEKKPGALEEDPGRRKSTRVVKKNRAYEDFVE